MLHYNKRPKHMIKNTPHFTDELKKINIGLCVVLFFIFIYLLYLATTQDTEDKKILDDMVCHKEVVLPEIYKTDELIIESVIEKYLKKKHMNKSNSSKIWIALKQGAFRGALGGFILSKGLGGALSGAVVFSALSGIPTAYNIVYGKPHVLSTCKHT